MNEVASRTTQSLRTLSKSGKARRGNTEAEVRTGNKSTQKMDFTSSRSSAKKGGKSGKSSSKPKSKKSGSKRSKTPVEAELDVPSSPDGSKSQASASSSTAKPSSSKSGACEACYLKKVKCDLADNQDKGLSACSRCLKKKQTCIPRYRRRGRPTALSSNGKSSVRFPTFRKVEGWRCCEAFLAQPGSEAQYAAAGNLVAALKKQGSTDPLWLRWAVKMMMQMAVFDKSMGLLHAGTTLAVSAGIEVDTEVMRLPEPNEKVKGSMLTPGMARQLSLSASNPNVPIERREITAAGYLFKVEYGERIVQPDQHYEYLFMNQAELSKVMKNNPGLTKFWHAPINDPEDIKVFVSMWMGDIIRNRLVFANNSMVNEYRLPDVKIHDRFNNVYVATLEQVTHFAEGGSRFWQTFSFTNIRQLVGEKYEAPPTTQDTPSVAIDVVAKKRGNEEIRQGSYADVDELDFFSDVHEESEQLRADMARYKKERVMRRTSLVGDRELDAEIAHGPLLGPEPNFDDDLLEIDILTWPEELLAPDSALVSDTFDSILTKIDG